MTALEGVTLISVAGGVVAAGVRYIGKPCYRGIQKVRSALTKVDAMHVALGDNGGKSLADIIRKTYGMSLVTDARLDLVIDLLDRPLFECAPNGENVRINEAFTKAFGWSPADTLAHRWVRIIHPEDRDRYMREWAMAVRDQRAFQTDARYLTKSGSTVQVRIWVEPNFDDSTREIVRWLGRVETITVDRSGVIV